MRETVEAIITSPLGEIRVWLEPTSDLVVSDAHAVRTSVRLDYANDPAAHQASIGLVVGRLSDVLRGLNLGRVQIDGPAVSPFAAWLAERTITDTTARTLSADLFADYCAHVARLGGRAMSAKAVGDALRDRQFGTAGKNQKGQQFRGGLRLRFISDQGPSLESPQPDPQTPLHLETAATDDAPRPTQRARPGAALSLAHPAPESGVQS